MLNARKKPHKSLAMEGIIADWDAKNTGRDLVPDHALAARIADRLNVGGNILEQRPLLFLRTWIREQRAFAKLSRMMIVT